MPASERLPTGQVLLVAAALAASVPAQANDNPKHGAEVYRVCSACHSLQAGIHLTGPSLADMWGRKAASAEGFVRYSKAFKSQEWTWDETTLNAWLADPKAMVPDNYMTTASCTRPHGEAAAEGASNIAATAGKPLMPLHGREQVSDDLQGSDPPVPQPPSSHMSMALAAMVALPGDASSGRQTSKRLPAVGLSLLFVLGFSTAFVSLGASATTLGQLLLRYRYETNIVGGAIIIVFGLFVLGLLQPSWLQHDLRLHLDVPGGRPIGAYVLGLAFAFGWTPCIGPVLGAILTVSAASATVSDGVVLLAVYSLGLGLPFLIAAAFTGAFLARMQVMRRLGRPLQLFAGGVMVMMGLAMITGYMSAFSFWLLETFPGLGALG